MTTAVRHRRKEAAPPRARPFAARLVQLQKLGQVESTALGRRSHAISAHGSTIRAVRDGHGFNVVGTVLAAADRGARIDNYTHRVPLKSNDVRGSIRRGSEANLVVFLVDASGSMAARDRLSAVTGAIMSMLTDAYQRRDKVAVITIHGSEATVVLPPTRSITIAARRLADVKTGGRTPLAAGLDKAYEVITREHYREPGRRAILMCLSDGRANGKGGLAAAEAAARRIARRGLAGSVVIDCERQGRVRLGLASRLAAYLHAPCVRLDELSADNLGGVIKTLS